MDDARKFLEYLADPENHEGIEQPDKPLIMMDQIMEHRAQERESEAIQENLLPPILAGDQFPAQYELVKRAPMIDGLFRQGDNVLLTAPSKMGKSWFLSTMAVCLASGKRFLDMEVRKSSVMILDLELHRDDAMDRLWSITNGLGLEQIPKDLYLWPLRAFTYDLDTLIAVLQYRLQNMPGIDCFIVDPIYMLESIDENNVGEVRTLLKALTLITRQTGATLILSHHYRKGNMGKEDHIDRGSGSGAFARFPDSLLSLSHHEEYLHAILEITGRSMPKTEPVTIKMTPPLLTSSELKPVHRKYNS